MMLLSQDAIVIAVGHREYCNYKIEDWEKMLKPNGVIIDVKSLYNSKMFRMIHLSLLEFIILKMNPYF